jgi:hypothetical protein
MSNQNRGGQNGDHRDRGNQSRAPHGNDDNTPAGAQKDPEDWVTGDESMTGAQASYLRTLAQEAGEDVDDSLTKAEASKRIEELQDVTGRGRDH